MCFRKEISVKRKFHMIKNFSLSFTFFIPQNSQSELRNETIIVNIFVNVLLRILLFYISITSNIEALSYVGSKKVSENIKFIMYFSTYFYLMYINYINCGVLNFNIYSKCTQIKKISSI